MQAALPFKPLSHGSVNKRSPSCRLVKKAGLSGVRFHDLRHSHATQLFKLGIHPKIVSERLGHSNVNITLTTYSHVLPGMQDEAIAKYDAVLREAFASNE